LSKLYVPPNEYRLIKPLIDLAEIIREKIKKREEKEVSRYRITKVLEPLFDLVSGGEASLVVGEMIKILVADLGLSEEEKTKASAVISSLVEQIISIRRRRSPTYTYNLIKRMRDLFEMYVRGYVAVSFEMYSGRGEKR
jgi:transcription initiation factor TFIIIB Brf1 subunit/transcription initiation factor TFIIB